MQFVSFNDGGHFDFRGADHFNDYTLLGKDVEHLSGHARVAYHTGADDRHFYQIVFGSHFLERQLSANTAQYVQRLLTVGQCHSEAEIRFSVRNAALYDNIDVNFSFGKRSEYFG
ncbi:hypothetical protein D3C81_2021630 [compost metagenome]